MACKTKMGFSEFLFIGAVLVAIKLISDSKNLITLGPVGGLHLGRGHGLWSGLPRISQEPAGKVAALALA